MKILAIIILSVLLILIGVQIFSFFKQEHDLNQTLVDAQNRLAKAEQDEANLAATMQYLSNPSNLAEQLRARRKLDGREIIEFRGAVGFVDVS